jgi:hypothetical protein
MIDSIKDWFADRIELIVAVVFGALIIGVIAVVAIHEMNAEQHCHDAGGHWVSQKGGGQCWTGRHIHP